MAYRNYATAVKHIVDTNGFGDFTTIAAALSAASAGQTLFIRPGTYTENPTLKLGVNLTAFPTDAANGTVTITGKCTFTGAGTVNISGIELKTNSDYALAVTGSAASVVNLINCQIDANNNTAINFSTSSASAVINLNNCSYTIDTTGIGLFAHSSAGSLSINNTGSSNAGASTTVNTASAGVLTISNSTITNPITTSGTNACIINLSYIATNTTNSTCLTLGGSGQQSVINTALLSGTASAASIGSTATMNNCWINSNNTNAITGAGTLNCGTLTFVGSSATINTSTQTSNITLMGQLGLNTPLSVSNGGTGNASTTAYALICGGTTTTGAYQAVADVAVNQVLISGGTSALPAFSAYPQISGLGIGASAGSTAGITFDGSNFLSTYSVGTWSPTIQGASTGGSTTYTAQNGYYTKIGNTAFVNFVVTASAATGTGTVKLGALPFTIKNQTNNNPTGALYTLSGAGLTWPTSSTYGILSGAANVTFLNATFFGTAGVGANLAMANTSLNFQGSINYQV